MRLFKKILKITAIVLFVILITAIVALHFFLSPESDDEILEKLTSDNSTAFIHYKNYEGHEYRMISMQKEIDSTIPTLVFVHGSPGSVLDYKRYFKDSLLNTKANILGYERIGYGIKNNGKVKESIAFELQVLHDVIEEISLDKIILIGYSYGGTIVLASPKNYKFKVSLASALKSEYEPIFKSLKLYDWKLTRWILPKKLQAATREKYSHLKDLPNFAGVWNQSSSPIVNIHGDKDWIVPYENSIFLERIIDKDKIKMVTIEDGGHELIWSDFELIRNEILKTIDY